MNIQDHKDHTKGDSALFLKKAFLAYRRRPIIFLFVAGLLLACGLGDVESRLDPLVQVIRTPQPETEIVAPINQAAAPPAPAEAPTVTPVPTPTPLPTLTPIPTPTPSPSPILSPLNTTPRGERAQSNALKLHGLIITFILPLILFGIPWAIGEVIFARYVQPRSIDLTGVLVKTQDGLFVNTIVSMTARKTLHLVSLTTRWIQVREVVEKAIEQELIHEALRFDSLPDFENSLKEIVESFSDLPIIDELSRDFGIDILRFNIEMRYPSETKDALNRKAEASAGGQAYVAFARAAHLDSDSPEARQLYTVFEETSGQVDAARNLGGGITSLANLFIKNDRRTADLGDQDEPDS